MARHAYWVILVGATPTAFRSSTRDGLVPTWRQLQRTQSDVTLRWFERGRLWESPEAARFGMRAKPEVEKRRPDWRPGGDHRDPRARFELTRDQKRARFKDRARRPREEPPPAGAAPAPPPNAPHSPDQSRKPWSSDRPPRRPWQRPKSDRPNDGRGPGGRFRGPRDNRPQDPRGPRPAPAPRGPVTPQAPGFKPQGPGSKPQRPFAPPGSTRKPYRPFTPDRDRPKGRGPGHRPGDRRGPGRPPGGRGGPPRGGGGKRHR
jgi:hypothetical protein